MAKAYASAVINAPIATVWQTVRRFDGLPSWIPFVVDSMIEDGAAESSVGCIRSFHNDVGDLVRERLLALDDLAHRLVYNFETPAFPVDNYIATIQLMPVTATDATFIAWEATFDEAPEDAGKYAAIIGTDVFAAGLAALQAKLNRATGRP